MHYIKKNILLTFGIFLLILSIGSACLGYWGGSRLETKATLLSNMTWSFGPTTDYDYIKNTDSPNRYLAKDAKHGALHLIDSKGQFIDIIVNQRDLGRGYYEFYNEDYLCGVVNEEGEVIIEAEHGLIKLEGDYFIVRSATDRISFWTLEGKCIYEDPMKSSTSHASHIGDNIYLVNEDLHEKSYLFYADTLKTKPLSTHLTSITHNGKGELMGMYNERYYPLDKNYDIIEDGPIYSYYGELSEGLRYVTFYDKKTEETTPCYIDENDNVVITLEGEMPKSAGPFREEKALLYQGNQLICINKTGQKLFALDIHHEDSDFCVYEDFFYSEGYALVTPDDDKYGYIDKTGEFVVSPIFDHAEKVKDGHAVVAFYNDEDEYGILNIH